MVTSNPNIRDSKMAELYLLVQQARAHLSKCVAEYHALVSMNDTSGSASGACRSSPLHAHVVRIKSVVTLLCTFEENTEYRVFLTWAANTLSQIISSIQDKDNRELNYAETSTVLRSHESGMSGCNGGDVSPTKNSATKEADDARDAPPSEQFRVQSPQDINTSWDHVIGAKAAVMALKQAVVLPQRMPQLFSGARKPWGCILLYGPPGTGKTLLASASAKEAGTSFLPVSVSDLLSKWVGDTEKSIRDLFRTASQCDRCIIFLDEVDALCGARGSNGESEGSRRAKTEFLVRMQNVDSRKVTIIAATNLPWELDTAFRRRFDRVIYVGLPLPQERSQLLRHNIADAPHTILDQELDDIAQNHLEGFSPCDIAHICQHSMMISVERLQSATHFRIRPQDSLPTAELLEPCSQHDPGAFAALLDELNPTLIAPLVMTIDDLRTAATSHPLTITKDYLLQYESWEASLRTR